MAELDVKLFWTTFHTFMESVRNGEMSLDNDKWILESESTLLIKERKPILKKKSRFISNLKVNDTSVHNLSGRVEVASICCQNYTLAMRQMIIKVYLINSRSVIQLPRLHFLVFLFH